MSRKESQIIRKQSTRNSRRSFNSLLRDGFLTRVSSYQSLCDDDVTLANGLDLERVHEDHGAGFFTEIGVAVGMARRFVGDIGRCVTELRD